jgi:hypothetical protein
MAKNKHGSEFLQGMTSSAAAVDSERSGMSACDEVSIAPAPQATLAGVRCKTVTITLPVGDPRGGYLPKHVEVRFDVDQAAVLQRLYRGMRETNVELRNGRPVDSVADVFRHLIELASEELAR